MRLSLSITTFNRQAYVIPTVTKVLNLVRGLDALRGRVRVLVVDNANTDPVLVAVGIRGVATFELAIPAAMFDAFKLLELIDRYGIRK